MSTLRLVADIYDQPQEWGQGRDAPTNRITKGQVFEPLHAQERDRLIEQGAAEDPEEQQRKAEAELNARRAQLDAERAELDAQIEAASIDPEKLKGDKLDEALAARELDQEGSVADKRSRLAAYIAENALGAPAVRQLPPDQNPPDERGSEEGELDKP